MLKNTNPRKAVKNKSEKVIQPWRKLYHEYLSSNKTKLEQEAVAKKNIPEEMISNLIILGHWMWVAKKHIWNFNWNQYSIHMYFEGSKAINIGQFVTEKPMCCWKFENCVGHPSRVTSTINRIIKENPSPPFAFAFLPFTI